MSERSFPWRTALFVSLALNLLVAGAVGGAVWAGVRIERGPPPSAERAPGGTLAAGGVLASLPADLREKLREQANASERDPLRLASWQARLDAYEAAAAEPYDSARVRAAFARMREADQAALGAVHDDFAEALATLPEPQRREALESLRRTPRGWRAPRDRVDAPAIAPRGERLEERRERREQRRERWRQEREARRREAPPPATQP